MIQTFNLSILILFVVSPLAVYAHSECEDDDSFKFKTEYVNKKDCEWLSEKTKRQDKYCNTYGWDDKAEKKVKYACKAACSDFLSSDKHCHSDSKSKSKGSKGSKSASTSTSASASASTSADESEKKCTDDEDYEFETEFTGMEDCSWLSEKAKRQYKYCETRGWDDEASRKVKYACRKSCANFLEGDQFDKCDKYEDDDYVEDRRYGSDDDCKNEKNFEFETEYAGTVKCSWLDEKEDRKEKYCEGRGWDDSAEKKVKYGCKAACGC